MSQPGRKIFRKRSDVVAAIVFGLALFAAVLNFVLWPDQYKANPHDRKKIERLVHRYYEVYNAGDAEAVKALYVPKDFRGDGYGNKKFAAEKPEERIRYRIDDIIEKDHFGWAYIETALDADDSTSVTIEAKCFFYAAEWMILQVGEDGDGEPKGPE